MPSRDEELAEDVDLDPDRRRYVLEVFDQLKSLSYYELLRVPRDADKKAIKRAYFDLVGLVHPDRYFGKKLGSYKPKMEAIFVNVTKAYETLLSKDGRAKYDATLRPLPAPAPAGAPGAQPGAGPAAPQPPPRKAPVDPRLAERQKAAAELLKQRFEAGRSKVKEHAEAGERARKNGDFVRAAEAYRAALALSPNDAAIRAALAEVERTGADKLYEALSRQAEMLERFGRWSDAADSWRRVIAVRPADREANRRLAEALGRAGRGS